MRWADVEAQQPRLAELGRRKFAEPGVVRWPGGGEQVRRGTSATSVGPPEPHPEFVD